MRTIAMLLVAGAITLGSAFAAPPAAPTFQELMDPALFPEPQRGMVVEAAEREGATLRIRTTGARIVIDTARGDIEFHQRIGRERALAILRFARPLEGAEITHSGPGFARVTFAEPALTVRVNGDSLFMLHTRDGIEASVDRRILPAWHGSFDANRLIADEWGAFGLYCSERRLDDHFDPLSERITQYALPADAVLWVGVCPPKPYDWERSFEDHVVWHWSNQLGYPPDEQLRAWSEHGNIVLLQSEVMLWKDWNVDFVPRLGEDEFARVRRTLHDLDMRFIVYTSPFYFLKDTALEPQALNSFENFTGWPPGTPTGENMELFMEAIGRVMRDYRPDGLYFDGQYTENPAALYALARRAREVVGEDGILEWHSTWALGSGTCYLPHADAYVDFILRGELQAGRYEDLRYLRFFVSGYNINNCIGVLCNNDPAGINSRLAADVLRVNARLHTIAGWLHNPAMMEVIDNEYRPALTPALRETVEREIDARQARAQEEHAALVADHAVIKEPPRWGDPAFAVTFEELPDAEPMISEKNAEPFAAVDGALQIRAHAHTFAYYGIPLNVRSDGFIVRLRQGTDGGMSWGPAAMLRWPGGAGVRIGSRGDGTLQADVIGTQWHGGTHDPGRYVWLRARWGARVGVVERSDDGIAFERLYTFEHGGLLNGPAAELLVGKVPYAGEPKDHVEAGEQGECLIDFVRVYGD